MLKFKMEEAGGASGGSGAATPDSGAAGNVATGGGAAAAPNLGTPDAGDGAGKSWLEGLGDMGKDPSLQMFKDPASLAKSWVNAQKMIGADKVVIPGKEATEQDWQNFYSKIGRPESPDKYEVKDAQGKDLMDAAFKTIAHKNGLTANQVKALVQWDAERMGGMQKQTETAQMAQLRDSVQAYTEKLGGEEKFKATVDKARIAVRELAPPELKEFLLKTGAGSRPEIIDFFAKIHGMMGDDKIRDGTGVPFTEQDPAAIQREIEEVEKKMYSDLGSTNMQQWVEQRSKLYERLQGLRQG